MNVKKELSRMRRVLLGRIGRAHSKGDLGAVAALMIPAKELEAIQKECLQLEGRMEGLKNQINGSSGSNSAALSPVTDSPQASRKALALEARKNWIVNLRSQGIVLSGSGKRYQTSQGHSVSVAFAREDVKGNRWFLGLRYEPTEVAVLLCRSLTGVLHEIVLPVADLGDVWRALSRSPESGGGHEQVKINVKKVGGRFLLLVPKKAKKGHVDVTRYVGDYGPLC